MLGIEDFPVFTRKVHSDISYIACARKLVAMADRIYPQFATHNAHSATAILHLANDAGLNTDDYEFQRLHGMGEALHETVKKKNGTRCRIYAPVGAHRDLLAYLVRRLLENGANSSFVNQMADYDVPSSEIAADPFAAAAEKSETCTYLSVRADQFAGLRFPRSPDARHPVATARCFHGQDMAGPPDDRRQI